MILIGFLHQCRNPRHVVKAYAFASVAKAEGVELLYFSPKQVNFKNIRYLDICMKMVIGTKLKVDFQM